MGQVGGDGDGDGDEVVRRWTDLLCNDRMPVQSGWNPTAFSSPKTSSHLHGRDSAWGSFCRPARCGGYCPCTPYSEIVRAGEYRASVTSKAYASFSKGKPGTVEAKLDSDSDYGELALLGGRDRRVELRGTVLACSRRVLCVTEAGELEVLRLG